MPSKENKVYIMQNWLLCIWKNKRLLNVKVWKSIDRACRLSRSADWLTWSQSNQEALFTAITHGLFQLRRLAEHRYALCLEPCKSASSRQHLHSSPGSDCRWSVAHQRRRARRLHCHITRVRFDCLEFVILTARWQCSLWCVHSPGNCFNLFLPENCLTQLPFRCCNFSIFKDVVVLIYIYKTRMYFFRF